MIPFLVWMPTTRVVWPLALAGAVVLVTCCAARVLGRRQNLGPTPHHQKSLRDVAPFDPATQEPVIHASICTGERVAGFKDKTSGRFTEVMLIRTPEDERVFRETYQIETLKTEY